VVDASVFPRIPGFFIVTSVFTIAEKAADAILSAAGHAKLPGCIYNEGFWCHLRNGLSVLGRGLRAVRRALAPVGKVIAAIVAALLLITIGIVTVSWFITEPPSEHPNLAKERRTINELVQTLTKKVDKQYAGKLVLRDTHPKGDACVKANITVDPSLPPAYRVGFLKGKPDGSMTYKAWIRFSNAADTVTPDYEPDFRGLAIKMFGVSGPRLPKPGDEDDTQDLLFIGHDAFFVGSAQDFLDFFRAANAGGGTTNPMRNPYIIWDLLTHPRGAYNLLVGRKIYPTIDDIRWFGIAPFEFGNAKTIVRYSVFPERQQAQYDAPGKTPYYLRDRLQNQLNPANNNHLRLDLNVQFRNDPRTEPLENTLVPWSTKTSPWHKVATIDIYPQTFTSSAQAAFCERLTFNPWHGLKAHKPVGGVNAARRDVMHAMQDVRLKADHLTRFGPHELTGNESFN
jgi:hypothetical protein